jgi:uncharacterized protein DUF3124
VKTLKLIFSLLLLCVLAGCEQPAGPGGVRPLPPPTNVSQRPVSATSMGQTLYVPCYSHVYLQDGRPYELSITLSLRNTSQSKNLIVKSVEYYDSAGKLLKSYSDHETVLGPLATTEYFVEESDATGGSGANFLVTWGSESDEPIQEPVVQALMVGTSGNIGVSFLTEAILISSPTPTPPSQ